MRYERAESMSGRNKTPPLLLFWQIFVLPRFLNIEKYYSICSGFFPPI